MDEHTQHGWEEVSAQEQQDFTSAPSFLRTDKDFSVKEFYTFGNIEAVNKKGQKVGYTQVFATYTARLTDFYLGCIQTTAIVVQLPPAIAAGRGKKYTIKDESGTATTNTITINGYNSELFDGGSSTRISTNYGSVTTICSGSAWFIV